MQKWTATIPHLTTGQKVYMPSSSIISALLSIKMRQALALPETCHLSSQVCVRIHAYVLTLANTFQAAATTASTLSR